MNHLKYINEFLNETWNLENSLDIVKIQEENYPFWWGKPYGIRFITKNGKNGKYFVKPFESSDNCPNGQAYSTLKKINHPDADKYKKDKNWEFEWKIVKIEEVGDPLYGIKFIAKNGKFFVSQLAPFDNIPNGEAYSNLKIINHPDADKYKKDKNWRYVPKPKEIKIIDIDQLQMIIEYDQSLLQDEETYSIDINLNKKDRKIGSISLSSDDKINYMIVDSRINKPYRNKGLYRKLLMKLLDEKPKIILYSVLRTEHAEFAWDSINKNLPNDIKLRVVDIHKTPFSDSTWELYYNSSKSSKYDNPSEAYILYKKENDEYVKKFLKI